MVEWSFRGCQRINLETLDTKEIFSSINQNESNTCSYQNYPTYKLIPLTEVQEPQPMQCMSPRESETTYLLRSQAATSFRIRAYHR